ncbi:MAG: hypothetical protein ACP5XB_04500 [Isosphaeraceae bacterium]
MSQRVVCTGCGRVYDLDDSFCGKKVRCKTCGAVARVPGAPPASSSSPPPLSANDLYGLDEGPVVAPASPKRDAAAPVDEDLPRLPRAVKRSDRKKQSSSSFRFNDLLSDSLFKRGAQFFIGGLVIFIMPFFGLVLAPRFSRQGLPPAVQQALGLVSMLIGLGMLIVGTIRAVPGATARLLVGSVVGMVLVGVIIAVANMDRSKLSDVKALVDSGAEQPAGAPGPAPSGPLLSGLGAPPPAPPPQFHGPADSVHITLSGGKYSRPATPFGTPLPGVEIEVHYRVDQGMAVGSKFNLVIDSKSTSGKLTTFTLRPEGTIMAKSPIVSVDDGPFQVHVEAESFDGRVSKGISNTISLQRDDSVNTMNNPMAGPIPGQVPHPGPFPGGMQPGMGRPPGMPNMPGFPGLQPHRPGFGGRGMRH